MARDVLLPAVAPWDCDCDPPPAFYLPPPPQPPSLLPPLPPGGPVDHSGSDQCNGPWSCPAMGLQAGGQYGQHDEDRLNDASSSEVPVAVIVVSAVTLGLFVVVAAVIFIR